ncbi:MAG: MFS transporter [Chloroflexota bacterium]|nr:MFS transporter [Chloroflexota bacterium]
MQAHGTHSPVAAGRAVLVTAALGTMLAPLNSTMIVVALPDILAEFDRSLAWGSWIVISYLVAMAAVQPLGGSLGDRYGRRRLFLIGLTGFLAATVLAALAWRIEVLIAARTVQAIAGATAIPNGTALVRSLIPPERQGRAFGMIGSGIAVAAGVGPPLGGIVTDSLGWRWIFAANILLIVPALVLGVRLPAGERASRAGRFDLRGALLLTSSLVSLALSLTVWRLPGVPLIAAPGFGAVAILSWITLRRHVRLSAHPILNLGLFRRPGFLPASLTVLLSNLTMYTILLSLPVFLTKQDSWSSSQVGLLLAGMSLQMIVVSPVGGWLSDHFGRRVPAVAGTTLIAAGTLPFLAVDAGWGWALYLAPLVVVGIGIGLSSASVQTAAIQAASASETGQSAGLFSTMRYLGSILGSAGMAAILTGSLPTIAKFHLLYAVLFLAACGAVISASRLPAGVAQQPVVADLAANPASQATPGHPETIRSS